MVKGDYVGHSFYGDYAIVYPAYDIIISFVYISYLIGMAVVFFEFERVIKRTRYFFTILNLTLIVPTVLLPFESARNINMIFGAIDAVIILSLLIWLSKNSSQEFQAVIVLMLIGFLLYMAGMLLDSRTIKELKIISPILPAFLIIIGAIIAVSPTFINPEYYSRSSIYWLILLIFNGILLFIILYIFISVQLSLSNTIIFLIGIFLVILVMVYSFNRFVRALKVKSSLDKVKEGKPKTQDFLKGLIRPKKYTEEEITFYREQKICLVCKGKVSKLMYICPKCNALYCQKCSVALIDLENVCWVCETPFDDSKPIKLLEKEEEKREPKQKIHKKSK